MGFKKIFQQLNIFAQCRRYGLPLWQCPQFLFLIMGIVIIGSTLVAYAVGARYISEPEVLILLVLLLAIILFVITFVVTRSFERLAEVARMKSEFVSVVSHQLRAPLSNLKWAVELLMSGRLGEIEEKQIEYFKVLKENSARMAELVSDLLIVSRIETATLPSEKEEVFLEDLIKDLISKFEPFATASNVKVSFRVQGSLPQVLADPSQIKIVFENLLDNAIRYVKDKGEIVLKLEGKGENLYFEIRDNGVGIPREDQEHIFQKFFRSKNALRHQTQGTGLGLYISKAIIERSGGKIGFKSQEGAGSIFWFTLPVR
ncbi:HAMP domain-containing histidine kinase [Patescibacteria group bacterium]|nr:HAMP domain-containing histidine kinase [Patescibacteria group bacterium]